MARQKLMSSGSTPRTDSASPEASDFPVRIHYGGQRLTDVRGQNLFAVGMELVLRSVTLPIGTLIDLEFDQYGRTWSIPAEIVYQGDLTTGVVFRTYQPEIFRELVRIKIGGHSHNQA